MWLSTSFFHALACIAPLGHPDLIEDIKYVEEILETSFDTNVHVEVSCSYPQFSETNSLQSYVNENVKKEAHALYDAYIQKMNGFQEDVGEEKELTGRTLHYNLRPIYCSPSLISLYGSEDQYAGGVHGSVHYVTRTFWQNNGIVAELSLDDLFLTEGREWLFQYCENYFKSHKSGYYSSDDHSWVIFGLEHLDAFLLTKEGILLLFQNYVVSGFNDFPTTLLIPYSFLATIANPNGPLKKIIEDEFIAQIEEPMIEYDLLYPARTFLAL